MEKMDKRVDFSSLPMINGGNPIVEISVASENEELCEYSFQLFSDALKAKSISYEIIKNY